MSHDKNEIDRRDVLKGFEAFLPCAAAAGLAGCSSGDDSSEDTPASTQPDPTERNAEEVTRTDGSTGTRTDQPGADTEMTETEPRTDTTAGDTATTTEPSTGITATETPQNADTKAEITESDDGYELGIPDELEEDMEYGGSFAIDYNPEGKEGIRAVPAFVEFYQGEILEGDGPLEAGQRLDPSDDVMNGFIFPHITDPNTDEEEMVMEIYLDEEFIEEHDELNIAWNGFDYHDSREFDPEEIRDGIYKDTVKIEDFRDRSAEAPYGATMSENIVVGNFDPENIEYRTEKDEFSGDFTYMERAIGDSTYIGLGERFS